MQKLDFHLHHACLKDRMATESSSEAPHVLKTDAKEGASEEELALARTLESAEKDLYRPFPTEQDYSSAEGVET